MYLYLCELLPLRQDHALFVYLFVLEEKGKTDLLH